MIKKLGMIFALILTFCMVLTGCAGGNAQSDEHISRDSEEDAVADSNVIYAPVEDSSHNFEDTSDIEDSQDTADSTDTDDFTDTETVVDSTPVTDPEDVDDAEEDTEAFVGTDSGEVIKLGEDFRSGMPVSGRIYSTQNEKIRLAVDYNCQMLEDGSTYVYFEIGLECYDINCGERVNGGKFTVNGETYTFSTHDLVHEETEKMYIPFADYIYQFEPQETSCEIDASWFFNGVYAGVKIDTLCVKAVFDWSADVAP